MLSLLRFEPAEDDRLHVFDLVGGGPLLEPLRPLRPHAIFKRHRRSVRLALCWLGDRRSISLLGECFFNGVLADAYLCCALSQFCFVVVFRSANVAWLNFG